ncbi:hypothetical protein N7539_008241 [Penicillium diatomitis]|uniref:Uncharacterized protein n=1 Tax=Penicillium diatomitis TaxID=2819901 RepID=A0A9W9WTG4_9EURO|nr:uncharacterized protein N7539_008241 [Penicillium diatomitis]KAJ5475175.1 hypothetical protein N7539_008241 [Penicillium diatomitis]
MASNQSHTASAKVAFSTPEAAILEILLPGYTFISGLLLSYLHIDLAAYLQYIVLLAVVVVASQYLWRYVSNWFEKYLVSTAELRLDDEIFNYLMYWWSRQPRIKRTTRFLAGVRFNSYWSVHEDSDDEDKMSDDEQDSTCTESFDEYWKQIINRDKYKRLRFTPSQGRHYFWYQGRLLILDRRYEQTQSRWLLNNEKLYLSCLGRDPSVIHQLLAEAQRTYVERDGSRTIIYRGQRCPSSSTFDWNRCMSRLPRPLDTVILDETQKRAFLNDIEEYLKRGTAAWYAEHGIPYRRGYLLSGPPGTGKSSLCFAVAGRLGLKIYLLSLSSRTLDEDNLWSLFSALPRRCILLVEDVDASDITHSRGRSMTKSLDHTGTDDPDDARTPPTQTHNNMPPTGAPAGHHGGGKPTDKTASEGITLSSLLNVLDGVAASEGRILVMTTNHPEKLDEALLRAGRIDMHIQFRLAMSEDIQQLYKSIYSISKSDRPHKVTRRQNGRINPTQSQTEARNLSHKSNAKSMIPESEETQDLNSQARIERLESRIASLAEDFASLVPSGVFSPAEIQGYLLKHKDRPERAIEQVKDWVTEERKKKNALLAAKLEAQGIVKS